jgi:hypothetical protein
MTFRIYTVINTINTGRSNSNSNSNSIRVLKADNTVLFSTDKYIIVKDNNIDLLILPAITQFMRGNTLTIYNLKSVKPITIKSNSGDKLNTEDSNTIDIPPDFNIKLLVSTENSWYNLS